MLRRNSLSALARPHVYDADGRLVRETHVVDTVYYTTGTGHDVGGRVRWVTYPDRESAGSSSNRFRYDRDGRLIAVAGVLTNHPAAPAGIAASVRR